MQDTAQVQWDPASIDVRLPWESRIFIVYLCVISAIFVIKSVNLFWQLWSFRAKIRLGSDSDTADSLATLALAHRLPKEIPKGVFTQRSPSLIQQADARFLYVWEICSAKVKSMKRLAILTFLISVLVSTALLLRDIAEIGFEKYIGIGYCAGIMEEVLLTFCSGLCICAILYAAYSFYEGGLARRKISWNYYCTTIKNKQETN
jgi:hypothetical protein